MKKINCFKNPVRSTFIDLILTKFLKSNNADDGIRAISNLIFFNKKISHAQKAQNGYKQTKTKKPHFYALKNI